MIINNDRSVVAADGTQIAYGIQGHGPPLVLTNGLTTSVFSWNYLYPLWVERFTVITWDLKGHGRSEPARTAEGVTMAALGDDLLRILDDAGIDSATLCGFSMGAQVILETYRQAPERVDALIPLFGPYQRVLDTAFGPLGRVFGQVTKRTPGPLFTLAARAVAELTRSSAAYRLGQLVRMIGPDATPEDIRLHVDHLRELHPPTIAAMTLAAQDHSAADLLPRITVPTLIFAGDADPFAPAGRVGAPMQRLIPGAELRRMPHGTHTSLFEHAGEIDRVFADFSRRHGLLPDPEGAAATVDDASTPSPTEQDPTSQDPTEPNKPNK